MTNYKNGKIYKLVSFNTERVYIGSTCEKLSVRKAKHKSHYKQYFNGKGQRITSFEIVKYDDFDIILLEYYSCDTKEQLHARERYYIENTANCVKKVIPTRTKKEYGDVNREKIRVYKKQYDTENKEYLKAKSKEYTMRNIDSIKKYREANKERIDSYKKIKHSCSVCNGK
jgi:hypothetical protein